MQRLRILKEGVSVSADPQDEQVLPEPIDTDDNDEPFADASGDTEDEKPNENDPPETWLKGE